MIIPLLTSLVCSTVCGFGIWYVDRRLVGHGLRVRRIVSVVLIAISTATITLILFANLFIDTGEIEPLSYQQALVLFRMRVVTAILMILLGFLVALTVFISSIHAFASSQGKMKWRSSVVPAIALIMYFLTFWLVGEYRFFPVA